MTPVTGPVYEGYFADPFVLRHGGRYFAFGTGPLMTERAFEVLISSDLRNWSTLGGSLERLPDDDGLAYWAPEVAYAEGRFYMYYSVGRGDEGHVLRVATSERPEGPYRDLGLSLSPGEPFAIDPHPYRDDDGSWYLFFAKDYLDGERPGTGLAVARLSDMTTLADEPNTVLRASHDWQLFKRDRTMYGEVVDWHTLEGPFVVKRGGRYYCFFSGGNWQNESYGISFCVADNPLGPWSEPLPGRAALLSSRGDRLIGPGHNSLTTGPDGHDYLVFHAWNRERSARQMWVERLVWDEQGPALSDLVPIDRTSAAAEEGR